MNDFIFYIKEGWNHIISIDALDHLLFILALVAIYLLKDWKRLLILITAFTIGHSITLALSVFDILKMKSSLVEFLIPCTIIATGISNFFQKDVAQKKATFNYFFALLFGFIHGLGYANTIKFMLASDQNLAWSLFGFNIGLEIGQIIAVSIVLLFAYFFTSILKLKQKWWIYSVSIISILVAAKFAIERYTDL